MSKPILALLVVAASAISLTAAAARDYPFCIKGCDFGGGSGDCSFSSYQQCQATASGRDATCAANPAFSPNTELRSTLNNPSRKRF